MEGGVYVMAGRKPLWDEMNMPDKLILIEGWARDGLTEEQIYKNLGVSHTTFNKWKNEKVELVEALKKGKEVIDRMVENALLKSALGYNYEEDGMTKDGDVVPLRKVQHPNTTALIFWLKNRKPKEWRDRQEVSHEGSMNVTFVDDIGE